jgi:hypothetical protein
MRHEEKGVVGKLMRVGTSRSETGWRERHRGERADGLQGGDVNHDAGGDGTTNRRGAPG